MPSRRCNVKKDIVGWKSPGQTCGENKLSWQFLCVEEKVEYRKGSDASLGSWVCGSDVSYRTVEIEDEGDSRNMEGVPETNGQIGSLSSTSDRGNDPPLLVSGLLYSR